MCQEEDVTYTLLLLAVARGRALLPGGLAGIWQHVPQEQVKHCALSPCLPQLVLPCPRRAYTASLGETAVAFDFGPQVPVPKHVLGQRGSEEVLGYPLYILYENGETFLTYISLLQRYGLTLSAHGVLGCLYSARVRES